jgi:hypothetical protein
LEAGRDTRAAGLKVEAPKDPGVSGAGEKTGEQDRPAKTTDEPADKTAKTQKTTKTSE